MYKVRHIVWKHRKILHERTRKQTNKFSNSGVADNNYLAAAPRVRALDIWQIATKLCS